MLPPRRMVAKKNSIKGATLVLALAMFITGCTPPGPRALWKGKKCLDRGDVADAVAQLKIATEAGTSGLVNSREKSRPRAFQ